MLHTSVKFLDVSAEPNTVLQSVTGTVMELPQDFLYPFFVSSARTITVLSTVTHLITLTLILTSHC